MNRDTPERYISGVAAVNTKHSLLAMKRNKMYMNDQIGNITATDPIEGLSPRRDVESRKEFNSWRWSTTQHPTGTPQNSCRFPDSLEASIFFSTISQDVVRGGHFHCIVHNQLFRKYALVSVYTPQMDWFRSIYSMDRADQLSFESGCKEIIAQLYQLLESAVFGAGVKKSFQYHLLKFLQQPERLKPTQLVENACRGGIVILIHVLSILLKDWMKEAVTEMSFNKQNTMVKDAIKDASMIDADDEKREIADFFGWAIFSPPGASK